MLTLKPYNDEEITLPNWIGETSLTLAEIGAVVCLSCLKSGNTSDAMGERMGAEETTGVLKNLR